MKHCTFFACWLLRPKLWVARIETDPVCAVWAGAAKLVPAVASPPAASPITAAALTRVLAKALDRMCVPSGVVAEVATRECAAGGTDGHSCRGSDAPTGRPALRPARTPYGSAAGRDGRRQA